MVRAALALYRLAARALLPRPFYAEFGHELEETVAARLAGAGGAWGRWLALASELGVRIALGADRGSVLRMVLAQGLRVSVVGLAIGIAGTLALSRLLAAFLYDMEPHDPVTLLGVAVVLILVSTVACFAPAQRATSVDPVKVLSAE